MRHADSPNDFAFAFPQKDDPRYKPWVEISMLKIIYSNNLFRLQPAKRLQLAWRALGIASLHHYETPAWATNALGELAAKHVQQHGQPLVVNHAKATKTANEYLSKFEAFVEATNNIHDQIYSTEAEDTLLKIAQKHGIEKPSYFIKQFRQEQTKADKQQTQNLDEKIHPFRTFFPNPFSA